MKKRKKSRGRLLTLLLSLAMLLSMIPTYAFAEVSLSQYQTLEIDSKSLNGNAIWGMTEDWSSSITLDKSAAFYAQDSKRNGGEGGLPVDGSLTTDGGTPYQLTSGGDEATAYDGNDCIWLYSDTRTVTMDLQTIGVYKKIYVLATAGGPGEGNYARFSVELNYTDGTKGKTDYKLYDWYDLTNVNGVEKYYPVMRRDNSGGAYTGKMDNNDGPILQSATISAEPQKLLKSITFNLAGKNTDDNDVSGLYCGIFAVTGATPSGVPAAPVATKATKEEGETSGEFTANWDVVQDATDYRLDVATDRKFTHILAYYNNKEVGKVTSFKVRGTGISPDTTYYYRVRAVNSSGQSLSSNRISTDLPIWLKSALAEKDYDKVTYDAETNKVTFNEDVILNNTIVLPAEDATVIDLGGSTVTAPAGKPAISGNGSNVELSVKSSGNTAGKLVGNGTDDSGNGAPVIDFSGADGTGRIAVENSCVSGGNGITGESGGNGGAGIAAGNDTQIEIGSTATVSGGNGGSATTGTGGNGGDGITGGKVTVSTGGTVNGGNGGNAATGTGGNGGAGISGSDTANIGTVNGGDGGSGGSGGGTGGSAGATNGNAGNSGITPPGSASASDVTIRGTKESAITDTYVLITLTNDTFKDIISGDWITNLPEGLTQSLTRNSNTEVKITISGTPTAVSDAALFITIPSDNLTSGIGLVVIPNAAAKFSISETSVNPGTNPGGNTGGSGGGGSSYVPTENYTVPVKNENTVHVDAQIKDGSAVVSEITQETLNKVAAGTGSGVDTVTIDLSGAKQEVTGITLSKKSVETLAQAAADKDSPISTVTIEMTKASVVLDADTLKTLAQDAKGTDIRLVVEDTEHKNLNTTQQTALKNHQVAATFEAYFVSGGQRIHDFKGGSAVVSVEFTPQAGKDANYYHMVYVSDDGKLTRYKTKYENGMLMFTAMHFSDYAIIYDETEKNDTEQAQLTDAEKIQALKGFKLVARSKMSWLGNDRSVRVRWFDKNGKDLGDFGFDGYEIWRSVKRNTGYGKKPFFVTKKEFYHNDRIEAGKKYYYRVRGYITVDGKKYYTDWSLKAWRTVDKNETMNR